MADIPDSGLTLDDFLGPNSGPPQPVVANSGLSVDDFLDSNDSFIEPPAPVTPEEEEEDKSALQEVGEFGAALAEGATQELVGTADAEFVGRGGIGPFTESTDRGDNIARGIGQAATQAGIVWGSTKLGAVAGTFIGGPGIGTAAGGVLGAAAGLSVTFLQGIRRGLFGVEENLKQEILATEGREATPEEIDLARDRALLTTIGGEAVDTALAAVTGGAGGGITSALAAGAKGTVRGGVRTGLKAVGQTAITEAAKREALKQGATRLGQIATTLKEGTVGFVGEGGAELVQGAGERGAVSSVARGTDFGSEFAQELTSPEAGEDFLVGGVAQATVRAGATGIGAIRDRRAQARAQGGDIAPDNTTTDGAPLSAGPTAINTGNIAEGFEVAGRNLEGNATELDTKALILNKVATDLESTAVEQDTAIIPPDFAPSEVIQEALKQSPNLTVEPLPDGSTRITNNPEIKTNTERALENRERRRGGVAIELKQTKKNIESIERRQQRATETRSDQELRLADVRSQLKVSTGEDPTGATKFKGDIDTLTNEIDDQQARIIKADERVTALESELRKATTDEDRARITKRIERQETIIDSATKQIDKRATRIENITIKQNELTSPEGIRNLEEDVAKRETLLQKAEDFERLADAESDLLNDLKKREARLTLETEGLEALTTGDLSVRDPETGFRKLGQVERLETAGDLARSAQAIQTDARARADRIANGRTTRRPIDFERSILDEAAKAPTLEDAKKISELRYDAIEGSDTAKKIRANANNVSTSTSLAFIQGLLSQKQARVLGRAVKKTKTLLAEELTPGRNIGQGVVESRLVNEGQRDAIIEKAGKTMAELARVGKLVDTNIDSTLLNQALQGNKQAIAEFTPEVQKLINNARVAEDNLSKELQTEGVVEGPISLIFDKNRGVHLTRSYEAFTNPNWAKQVVQDKPVWNRAVVLARGKIPRFEPNTKAGDVAFDKRVQENLMTFLNSLAPGTNSSVLGALDSAFKRSGLSKDLGILKTRQEIAVETRALMGERVTAPEQYIESITRKASLLAQHRILTDTKRIMAEGGLLSPQQDIDKDHMVQIAAEDTDTLAPLNGMWTNEYTLQSLNKFYSPEVITYAGKVVGAASGVAKAQATVGSVQTHSRNVVGNLPFMLMNGYINPLNPIGSARAINNAMEGIKGDFEKAPNETTQFYKELFLMEGAESSELKALYKDIKPTDDVISTFLPKRAGKVVDFTKTSVGNVFKAYRAEDAFFKIIAFHIEKNRLQADPRSINKSEDTINKEAASIARRLTPTYGMTPKIVQRIRRWPFAPFITFYVAGTQALYNTAQMGKDELVNGPTKAIKARGAGRLVGAATVPFMYDALADVVNQFSLTSEEEEEALRQIGATWDENGALAVLRRTKDGDPVLANLNSINPFSAIAGSMTAVMRGVKNDNELSKIAVDGALELLGPLIQDDIFIGRILEWHNNQIKGTTKTVYNKNDGYLEQTVDSLSHILEPLAVPGSDKSVVKVTNAALGNTTKRGIPLDLGAEIFAVVGGPRVGVLPREDQVLFKTWDYKASQNSTTGEFTTVLKRKGTLSDTEIKDAFKDFIRRRRRIDEKFEKKVDAFRKSGLDDDQIIDKMLEAKLGEEKTENILYNPKDMPIQLSSEALKVIADIPGRLEQIESALGVDIISDLNSQVPK